MDDGERIAPVDAVPEDGSLLFTVRPAGDGAADPAPGTGLGDDTDDREAILVRDGATVAGWLNYCMHWTDVRLDTGSGATLRDGELVCGRHGATFDRGTGTCTFGPCEGATLDRVQVTVEDGDVHLADPAYEFVTRGSTGDHDRSTASRSLGF